MTTKPEAIVQIEALRSAAVQIQQRDFAGWGNTCNDAADYIDAQDAEIARLREAHEQEVENILDDAQEWAVYVIEDSAPCSLRHRLVDEINQRAALAATKKDPL